MSDLSGDWGGWGSGKVMEGGITKGQEETFGGDKYVHYVDSGIGIMDVYECQNLSNCIV